MQKVNPEGAERSLKARQNARLTPNEVSYSALINAYAQKGDPEGAERSLTYREASKKMFRGSHDITPSVQEEMSQAYGEASQQRGPEN